LTAGTTLNEVVPPPRPGELAVTVTVPGVNCDLTAIFVMPPSAVTFGSPGAWYAFGWLGVTQ
jgi:hypothetical protein